MTRTPDSAELLAGRYRLGRELGSGAHGTVYVAEDLGRGGERIALKVTQSSQEGLAFFAPAAQTLHWFRHPNWAEVYDAGVTTTPATKTGDGKAKGQPDQKQRWFQAMRLVEGRSLEALQGPQPLPLVYEFLEAGARVLQSMHEQGVIHYDVTPSNFILETSKHGHRFVLTDGGLAHLGPVASVARGTPLFMAPELTQDGGHDHRVDLYALGLIAFRLTTGEDPIPEGEGDFNEILSRVLGQRRRAPAPRAASYRPDVPAELDELLASLLDRDPEERPADGRTILLRLADMQPRPIPEVRRSEAFARADSGLLVDRSDHLRRFADSCRVLARQVPQQDGRPGSAPEIPPDTVLILQGAPASGGTRTVREMILQARIHEVPVLLLAGRDGAPDINAPLADLHRSFNALQQKPVESHRRRARLSNRGRAERTWSNERATEKFLNEAIAAASHTPYVLAIEDFGELPELARNALSVLARELLSRHEHGNTVAPPPVLLLLDMGSTNPSELLIADAEEPERPICALRALTVDEIAEIATSRFPGLLLTSDEAAALHGACEGAPATLIALMAEAIRRSELRVMDGSWAWDLAHVAEYVIRRRLPPMHANALTEADDDLKALLATLALVDGHLERGIAEALWSSRSAARFPSSPLISSSSQDGREVTALASHAIRAAILESLSDDVRKARTDELIAALTNAPSSEHAVDLSRLLIDTGDAQGALDALTKHASALNAQQRLRIQEHLRRICESNTKILEMPDNRRGVAALLERGSEAVTCAELLATHVPQDGTELDVVIRLVEVLGETGATSVQTLISLHAPEQKWSSPELAMLQLMGVRAELDRRELTPARELYDSALRTLRRLSLEDRRRPALGAFTVQRVVASEFRLETERALFGCSIAAVRSHARNATCQLSPSSTITWALHCSRQAPVTWVTQDLSRSLTIKRALGDIRGEPSAATFNLARTARLQGRLMEATSLSYDCVDRAQRYGLTATLVKTLRELAGFSTSRTAQTSLS